MTVSFFLFCPLEARFSPFYGSYLAKSIVTLIPMFVALSAFPVNHMLASSVDLWALNVLLIHPHTCWVTLMTRNKGINQSTIKPPKVIDE